MIHILKTYGVLVISLMVLFGSGIVIGRLTAPPRSASHDPGTTVTQSPEEWADRACRGLVRHLNLSADQEKLVRAQLGPVAAALEADRERALFQMHLRLLRLHDTLGASVTLSAHQQQLLAASRVKLLRFITQRFPESAGEHPDLTSGSATRDDTPPQ
jgi:hypothetical protein